MLARAAITHPKLAHIWSTYLDQNVEKAERTAFECMAAAERMNDGVSDYGAEMLAAAYVAYTADS